MKIRTQLSEIVTHSLCVHSKRRKKGSCRKSPTAVKENVCERGQAGLGFTKTEKAAAKIRRKILILTLYLLACD